MSEFVYIVKGTTGEWSDTHIWEVAGFFTLDEAERYAELCNNYAKSIDLDKRYDDGFFLSNPYDPNMSLDYTGTWYEVSKVPVGGFSNV